MVKDLKSFKEHDLHYSEGLDTYYSADEIVTRTEESHMFERSGYAQSLRMSNPLPKTHIDIGSGNGWLLRKMAPYFEKVIGIEPSASATEASRRLNKDTAHISLVNKDMVDAIKEIDLSEPVFFTTGAVFSHIEDFYVKDFLTYVNNAPINSVLFFSENYDRNMQWKFWHIRNKDWWINRLPNWQLYFCNYENEGYASGIYGVRSEIKDLIPQHHSNVLAGLTWNLSYFIEILKRGLAKIAKLLHIKN